MQEMRVRSLGWEDPLEEGMATHSSVIAWRIPVTNSWSLLIFLSIVSMMTSNHLILYHTLLLLTSIFPSIRIFSNESVLRIRWPKHWSFSFTEGEQQAREGPLPPMMLRALTPLLCFASRSVITEITEACSRPPSLLYSLFFLSETLRFKKKINIGFGCMPTGNIMVYSLLFRKKR